MTSGLRVDHIPYPSNEHLDDLEHDRAEAGEGDGQKEYGYDVDMDRYQTSHPFPANHLSLSLSLSLPDLHPIFIITLPIIIALSSLCPYHYPAHLSVTAAHYPFVCLFVCLSSINASADVFDHSSIYLDHDHGTCTSPQVRNAQCTRTY